MSSVAERLELCEAVLALIETKRTETKDPSLGGALEEFILNSQVQELEREILEDYPELEADDFRAVDEFCGQNGPAHRAVKLVLDENLSRKLVARLADLYPRSAHVADVGLLARVAPGSNSDR